MDFSEFIQKLKELEEKAVLGENPQMAQSVRFQIDISKKRRKHSQRKKYVELKWRKPGNLFNRREDCGWYWLYDNNTKMIMPIKIWKNKEKDCLYTNRDGGTPLSRYATNDYRCWGPIFVPLPPKIGHGLGCFFPGKGYDPDYDPGFDPGDDQDEPVLPNPSGPRADKDSSSTSSASSW